MPEKPRDVYLEACSLLGERFERDGFRYIKSRQRCEGKRTRSGNVIQFQSSHSNKAGKHVAVTTWVYASPTGSGVSAGGVVS